MFASGTGLQFIKAAITCVAGHQFVMATAFNNAAVFYEKDFIGMHKRCQPMGNDDDSSFFDEVLKCVADAPFSRGIDRGR